MKTYQSTTLYAQNNNLLLNTDSYKPSHFWQYPEGANAMFSYIEARSGGGDYPVTVFFGLQALLQENLSQPITHAMIDEAKALFAAHGEPFNETGWRRIVDVFGGYLPIKIRALPEGSVVSIKNALVTIESADPETFWLVSYIETWLLRVWYPTTVASQSWMIKQLIADFLQKTADTTEGLAFKLHDFGSRGVSSNESAGLGGVAHLVNFMGSDTLQALQAARIYYDEPMAAYSIPAAEHSTITSWGRDNELAAYRNMLKQFGKPNALFAVVSDSYNLWEAIKMWGTDLKDDLIASGATLVIRPDSGHPADIVLRCAREIERYFGSTVNSKGYRVLNHVRIIQGDGINRDSIREILVNLVMNGYSADNIAFGMGGALLQQVNRDTLGFAMKCSALKVGDAWRDVFKDPITDPGKTSKKGRLGVWQNRITGEYQTQSLGSDAANALQADEHWQDALQTVYENGQFFNRQSLADIRQRAADRSLWPNSLRQALAQWLMW